MRYFMIRFASPPSVTFAHGYDTANYMLGTTVYEGLELAYIEHGDVEAVRPDGSAFCIPAHSVWFLDHLSPPNARCPGGEHSHFTVGFSRGEVREIDCAEVIEVLSRGTLSPGGTEELLAVIPEYFQEAAGTPPERAIKAAVRAQAGAGTERALLCRGELLLLLGELTRCAAREAALECGRSARSEDLSFYRAQRYISARLDRRLTATDVAAELEISAGYLSRLFCKCAGMAVMAYINRAKLKRVCELLSNRGLTLAQAGAAVCITDTNYLSRMFKQYMGMTYREYRVLQNNH